MKSNRTVLEEQFNEARAAWLNAIEAKQEHYIVYRKWEAFCHFAHRLGRVAA